MIKENEWRTTKQIANESGFDYQRIRKAINELDLPHRKLGNEFAYTKEEVEKIINHIGDILNFNKNENSENLGDNEKTRSDKKENPNNLNYTDNSIEKRYIETLENQLKVKDEQIKSLEITIHRHEELINNLQNQLKIGQKEENKVIDVGQQEANISKEEPPQEEIKKKFIPFWRRHKEN